MSYQVVFVDFWEHVKNSLADGTFAKLTLAKTIGDTEIKNIFVRPVLKEDNAMLLSHIIRYKTEEIESEHTLDESFEILKPYLKNPFQSVLLFTTEFDLMLKINKKEVGSLIKQNPTFKNPSLGIIEMKEKGLL